MTLIVFLIGAVSVAGVLPEWVSDPSYEVRLQAVRQLTDQELLRSVARDDPYYPGSSRGGEPS